MLEPIEELTAMSACPGASTHAASRVRQGLVLLLFPPGSFSGNSHGADCIRDGCCGRQESDAGDDGGYLRQLRRGSRQHYSVLGTGVQQIADVKVAAESETPTTVVT